LWCKDPRDWQEGRALVGALHSVSGHDCVRIGVFHLKKKKNCGFDRILQARGK